MDNNQDAGFKPPYGAFRTFWSFVASLATKPLPPQIDRSILDSKSGTDQLGIFNALKAFNLVAGEEQVVQPALTGLVQATPEGRKTILGDLLQTYYPGQLKVSASQGTMKMLLESFESDFGLNGDTRRKAATWFLHAANECGMPMSAHFPKLRPGQGAPAPRARRPPKRKPLGGASGNQVSTGSRPENPSGTDEFTVELRAGGTVTLTVNVSHFALSRHRDDRDFVEKLMDAMTAYEKAAPGGAAQAAAPSAESGEEEDTEGG